MSIGMNIKKLRESRGLSQAQLAAIIGVTDKAVSSWEHNMKVPRMGSIEKMATYFNVTKSRIVDDAFEKGVFSYGNISPLKTKKVPLLGNIACGKPIYAEETKGEYVLAESGIDADFCLRAKGDSMIGARINDGDVVFVQEQSEVNNGEIAAIIIYPKIYLFSCDIKQYGFSYIIYIRLFFLIYHSLFRQFRSSLFLCIVPQNKVDRYIAPPRIQ